MKDAVQEFNFCSVVSYGSVGSQVWNNRNELMVEKSGPIWIGLNLRPSLQFISCCKSAQFLWLKIWQSSSKCHYILIGNDICFEKNLLKTRFLIFQEYGTDMTFLQRTLNFLATGVMWGMRDLYGLRRAEQILDKFFPGEDRCGQVS